MWGDLRFLSSNCKTTMAKTVLCIGAHYDDCAFGIPGIMLQAVRKNYRVVNLSLIGDYSNWAPMKGRHKELLPGCKAVAEEYGVEARFLNFASHRFDDSMENRRIVAGEIAAIKPDIAFMLWKEDNHNDHVEASALSKICLSHANQIIDGAEKYRRPGAIYSYDNGPGHTIGFEPNTFMDVTDVWKDAQDWLGKLMALVRNKPYDKIAQHSAQRAKETLARYRGASCGARYAEAVWTSRVRARDFL